jgi:hypothetical protein
LFRNLFQFGDLAHGEEVFHVRWGIEKY